MQRFSLLWIFCGLKFKVFVYIYYWISCHFVIRCKFLFQTTPRYTTILFQLQICPKSFIKNQLQTEHNQYFGWPQPTVLNVLSAGRSKFFHRWFIALIILNVRSSHSDSLKACIGKSVHPDVRKRRKMWETLHFGKAVYFVVKVAREDTSRIT